MPNYFNDVLNIVFKVNYILEAVRMVSEDGWKLLPQYIMNPDTGEWSHQSNLAFADRRRLKSISYFEGKFDFQQEASCASSGGRQAFTYADNLLKAKEAFK
jgi:hypothetical protein